MTPYLGEIRIFAGNYAPEGWHLCDGGLLPLGPYQALYSLIGTLYGGDGVNTFAVPDLRGRIAIGQGQGIGLSNRALAQRDGTETVTLNSTQVGAHNHSFNASTSDATTNVPSTGVTLANPSTANQVYYLDMSNAANGTSANFSPNAVSASASTTTPHQNMMPTMTLTYIICTDNGIYPSRPN